MNDPIRVLAAFVLPLALASELAAAIIAPGALATTEGDALGSVSGLVGSGDTTEILQIAASELAAQRLAAGDSITGVRTRLNGDQPLGPTTEVSWSDLTIRFAQATNPIGSMSTDFAANMTDPVTVRSGPHTLAANSMPGGASPNAFGALVSFGTPYVYQGGDLVFYLTHTAATGGAADLEQDGGASYAGAGTSYRALRNIFDYDATSGTLSNAHPVLRFETLAAVPEPAAFPSMAVAVMMMAVVYVRFPGGSCRVVGGSGRFAVVKTSCGRRFRAR